MGRQFRPPRSGQVNKFTIGYQANTASSTAVVIPNYGVTDLSTYAAGDWVLGAPDEGVRKTLVSVSSTSVARVIRMATDASVKCGAGGATQITFGQTTVDCVVVLVGVNSTRWVIESLSPVASTAAGLAFATS